jgi:hypothetical protein
MGIASGAVSRASGEIDRNGFAGKLVWNQGITGSLGRNGNFAEGDQ